MIKKIKEYNVLDIEDVEKSVSETVGRPVKIGEMDVTIIDWCPTDEQDEGGDISMMGLECYISVDGEEIDQEPWALWSLIPNEAYVTEEYIFNFSTDLFKSYKRYTDMSD